MDSPQIASRPASPHSADRLDRDRQAAPQVFERLRDMIVSLKLPPGSPLSRAALATQFGVSSTPIRDALMRLEEEGLVDVFPQHATVVSRIDVRLAQQAHFLRQALELEIVKALGLEHVDALMDELNGTIALQQKCARAGDFEKFMAADNDFHAQLYAATGTGRFGIWCAAAAATSTGCADSICLRPEKRKTSCAITNSSSRRSAPTSLMKPSVTCASICRERLDIWPKFARVFRNILANDSCGSASLQPDGPSVVLPVRNLTPGERRIRNDIQPR